MSAGHPSPISTSPSLAVVIPAYNEQDTVGEVVKVALTLTPQVVVASDGSADATAQAAREAGAMVVELLQNQGKGPALFAALQAADAEYVVMLDADLKGMTRQHLDLLVQPVLSGKLDMTIGVFEGGGFASDFGNKMTPHLSGQRACRREWLLSVPLLATERWPEPAITAHLKASGLRWSYVELPQVKQVLKETKRGFWGGVKARSKMYGQLLTFWARKGKS